MTEEIYQLVTNRSLFDAEVYTPLSIAIDELKKRNGKGIREVFNDDILLNNEPCFVLFRHVATPNFEVHRFISAGDGLGYKTVICEYLNNKFVSNNLEKKALGKMIFFEGVGKKGGAKNHTETIIDFNSSNGRKLTDIKTLWGESLVDFHHFLMKESYGNAHPIVFDASKWFLGNGINARTYYENLLKIFISNDILFENFLLDDPEERKFIETIFLPAFKKVVNETGCKPLIVPLEPTSIEGDNFWYSYPKKLEQCIHSRLKMIKSQ